MGKRVVELIRALVESPSISSTMPDLDMGNVAVIDVLAQRADALGFDVEVMALPGAVPKANMIATLGRGPGGLVLSGHTDTVPFDDGLWSSDPFKLTERDGRLYGLGVVDMKSFLALALEAASRIDPSKLQAPLIILATADEETTMDGARALVKAGRPKARYAVIGEPTGLRPIHMHKGIMMEAVRIQGRSGHSSNPALGLNAIEGMHAAIAQILSWRHEIGRGHRNEAFEVPEATVNLGAIRGGDAPNRICSHCEMLVDVRMMPGMDPDKVHSSLERRLEAELQGQGFGLEVVSLMDAIPPFETSAQSALVKAAEAMTGYSAQTVGFGTEGPFLNALGMETIIMGPGSIDQAHQPDEFLSMDQIPRTLDLLEGLIHAHCVEGRW